jgi:integrase
MLKAALNFAYDEGLVASNASWGRRLKGFRDVEAARIRYLSVPEAERLINAADRDFKPLIQAALATGARYSELAALRGQDFNPDAGTVAVRRSKTGKGRHIVLTTEGADLFTQLCAGRSGNELIFTHGNGAPWEKSDQLRPMAEAVRHARIKPPISFHGLRHTYASLAIMAGCPILVCAKNLGHTDGRMCEKHYGHLSASFVRDQIRATAPTFGFKPDKKIAVLENKRPR